MRKSLTAILSCLLVLALGLPALAQDEPPTEGEPAGGGMEEPDLPPEGATDAPTDEDLKTSEADVKPTSPILLQGKRVESRRTWKDIVVIPRKPFIKKGRVDLTPTFTVTVNDNILEHYSLGAEVNYHITDVLSIGVAGMYYFKNILDQEFWTRYHYNRVPSMNKYNYTVALNFAYVPIYGKLALLNKYILHYEVFASAGVGGSGTEIVPKDYRYQVFSNPFSLTFPIGVGGRIFVTKYFAIQAGFRDYMMIDKFEGPRGNYDACAKGGCTAEEQLEDELTVAKDNAETRFINNMQFFLGFSFYLPPSFEYTTFR